MTAPIDEAIALAVDAAARAGFVGVVRVDIADTVVHESAHGFADRAHSVPNDVDTRFAGASALKACTALTVMSLVESGAVALETCVRSVLPDCPFVDPTVTVRHLLSHRSGIGEYCEEIDTSGSSGHTATPGVAQCAIEEPSAILTLMAGTPARATPGSEFHYNNAGYVVLALLAEVLTGSTFVELVERHVFVPAGMVRSGILRYDALDGDVAIGYRERTGLRTNVHAVPNRGIGDGGLFTTAADMVRFWHALDVGVLVSSETVSLMTTAHGHTPRGTPYGLGFWLDAANDAVTVEGYDWGISFRSVHRPSTEVTWTVASNWTDGAWPLVEQLEVICRDLAPS